MRDNEIAVPIESAPIIAVNKNPTTARKVTQGAVPRRAFDTPAMATAGFRASSGIVRSAAGEANGLSP